MNLPAKYIKTKETINLTIVASTKMAVITVHGLNSVWLGINCRNGTMINSEWMSFPPAAARELYIWRLRNCRSNEPAVRATKRAFVAGGRFRLDKCSLALRDDILWKTNAAIANVMRPILTVFLVFSC
jgi:hypothetical protein